MDEEKKEQENQEGQVKTIRIEGMIIECPKCKEKIIVGFDLDIQRIPKELLGIQGEEKSGE